MSLKKLLHILRTRLKSIRTTASPLLWIVGPTFNSDQFHQYHFNLNTPKPNSTFQTCCRQLCVYSPLIQHCSTIQ